MPLYPVPPLLAFQSFLKYRSLDRFKIYRLLLLLLFSPSFILLLTRNIIGAVQIRYCIDISRELFIYSLRIGEEAAAAGRGGGEGAGRGGATRAGTFKPKVRYPMGEAVNSRRFDISDAVGLPRLGCAHFISQSVNRKTLRPRDIVPPCY